MLWRCHSPYGLTDRGTAGGSGGAAGTSTSQCGRAGVATSSCTEPSTYRRTTSPERSNSTLVIQPLATAVSTQLIGTQDIHADRSTDHSSDTASLEPDA